MFLKNKSDVIAINPPNFGWLEKTLSANEVYYLWKCIENKAKKSHKKELVGVICESNELNDNGNWFWENTLKNLIQRYTIEFGNIGEDVPVNQIHSYYLKSWWVNVQKQYI
jgi:hypothetical protein